MKFQRHYAPVLTPNPQNPWESVNVFNPSVVVHNGLFHMHYRAQGHDYISHIGYAVSADGITWNRLQHPVLSPSGDIDARGVEDPRVTELGGALLHGLHRLRPLEPVPRDRRRTAGHHADVRGVG